MFNHKVSMLCYSSLRCNVEQNTLTSHGIYYDTFSVPSTTSLLLGPIRVTEAIHGLWHSPRDFHALSSLLLDASLWLTECL